MHPTDAFFSATRKLQQYAEEVGRNAGAYVSYTLIAGETEAEAQAKSNHWAEHADREALATMMGQVALDNAGSAASVLKAMAFMACTPIAGSYAQCTETLDKFASMPGNKGIMLIFPECLTGLQEFGERVLPLMKNVKLKTAQQPEAT